jgi:hypothetical protein
MVKILVKPKSPNALKIVHPTDGPLYAEGSSWDLDGFTSRMLIDGEITSDDPLVKEETPPTPPSQQ